MLSSSPSLEASALLYASVILSLAFFVYGLNTLHLMMRSRRYKPASPLQLVSRPDVAIHLPIYNELYVVKRLLESCTRVAARYGIDRVAIYVVDDSTDETSAQIDRLVSGYSAQGYRFRTIRRGSRNGFKAGALQAALDVTDEKYVAVLDADFVPPADFLDRTVAILENDSALGFVQARWGHLDRNHGVITQSVAIGVDAHFYLEQQGRNGSGYLMNFNGSAGVLRADAIRAAGGWASDTLAEDLDLSYRIQLQGRRGLYLNDLEVPGELPPTISSLKRQQGRWARGSLQTAKKLLPRITLSRELSAGQKLEAGIHLTYYLVHPLMVASFVLAVTSDFLSIDVIKYAVDFKIPNSFSGTATQTASAISFQILPWVIFSSLIVLSTVAVLLYCVQAVRAQGRGLVENAKQIVVLVVLGYGVSISNSVHAMAGLFSWRTGAFLRTPKYAIENRTGSWEGKKYQLPFNKTTLFEAGAALLAFLAITNAFMTGNLGILPILLVYFIGYSFVLSLTFVQAARSSGQLDS